LASLLNARFTGTARLKWEAVRDAAGELVWALVLESVSASE